MNLFVEKYFTDEKLNKSSERRHKSPANFFFIVRWFEDQSKKISLIFSLFICKVCFISTNLVKIVKKCIHIYIFCSSSLCFLRNFQDISDNINIVSYFEYYNFSEDTNPLSLISYAKSTKNRDGTFKNTESTQTES